jgi:hypothetical protein
MGRRAGYDPVSSKDIFEIPDSSYIRYLRLGNADGITPGSGTTDGVKTFVIPQALPTAYQVQLAGTGSGSYELDLNTFTPGAGGQQPEPIYGTTAAGMIANTQFTVIAPPRIVATAYVSNIVSISFSSQQGVTYSLEGKQFLSRDDTWQTFTNINGSGGIDTIYQQSTNQAMCFRLKAE